MSSNTSTSTGVPEAQSVAPGPVRSAKQGLGCTSGCTSPDPNADYCEQTDAANGAGEGGGYDPMKAGGYFSACQQQQQPLVPGCQATPPPLGAIDSECASGCGGPVPEAPTEAWVPQPGGYDGLTELTVDTVAVVGLGNAAYYLELLFQQYLKSPSQEVRSPALASAFVTAVGHQARRACMVVRPMLRTLAELPELDEDGQEKLAALLADICCHTAVSLLFDRCKGQKRSMFFYTALLKAITESCKDPDLKLAVEVAEEMTRQGFKHNSVSCCLLMVGFTRHPTESLALQTALNFMDWRLAASSKGLEPCFANQFYAIVEMCSGAQVPMVLSYLTDTIAKKVPDLERRLLSKVLPCDSLGKSDSYGSDHVAGMKYIVVDPYTLTLPSSAAAGDAGADYKLPKSTLVMFLYSAVRDICLKASRLGEDHPLQSKLHHIRSLVAANPNQCEVLTLPEELEMRPPTAPACVAPHCRMLSFVTGVITCMDCSRCEFTVVTGDAGLEAALARIIPAANIHKQLPPLLM